MRANRLCKEKTKMKNLSSVSQAPHRQGADLLPLPSVYADASVISLPLEHLLSLISEWSLCVHWTYSGSMNFCSGIQVCKATIAWGILLGDLLHKAEMTKEVTGGKPLSCLVSAGHHEQSTMKVCELCSLKV